MKAILTDGKQKRVVFNGKSVNPWDTDSHPEAWIGDKAPANTNALVPAVYSSWQARCKAMSDLPFSIYGKGDNVVDESDDYKNKIGLFENPRAFLWMAEAALVGYGKAYWLKQGNKYNITKGLQYFMPDTITAELDPKIGLKDFRRKLGTSEIVYKPEEVLYIWLPDPSVEIGPPNVYPLMSALVSASALDKINYFIKEFMERGAIKAMLLSAKNMPDPEEAKRVENWFNRVMTGAKQLTWKIFNAEAFTPTIIGEGLEAFKGIEITTNLIQQIHTAMGTRQLMEDENYATAQIRQREFYTNTIMADARLISDALNKQVLNDSGYRLEFNPEELECFQEDEAANAAALGTLSAAIKDTPPEVIELSMSILGYTLSDEQQAMLDDIKAQKLADKENLQNQMNNKPAPANTSTSDPTAPDTQLQNNANVGKWLRKALKHIGKDVEFVCDDIPAEVCAQIHAALPGCKTAEEVKALFDIKMNAVTETPAPAYEPPDYASVLDGMRLTVEAIKMSLNPQITVNVEPSPTNVTVTPSTANIENIVNVPEAKVELKMPAAKAIQPVTGPKKRHEKQKITRDQSGAMNGTETEITYDY